MATTDPIKMKELEVKRENLITRNKAKEFMYNKIFNDNHEQICKLVKLISAESNEGNGSLVVEGMHNGTRMYLTNWLGYDITEAFPKGHFRIHWG